jgi:hypothetical protein
VTGIEHYRAAEQLLSEARRGNTDSDFRISSTSVAEKLAMAQIHATLALAAATALQTTADSGMSAPMWREWQDVTGDGGDSHG